MSVPDSVFHHEISDKCDSCHVAKITGNQFQVRVVVIPRFYVLMHSLPIRIPKLFFKRIYKLGVRPFAVRMKEENCERVGTGAHRRRRHLLVVKPTTVRHLVFVNQLRPWCKSEVMGSLVPFQQ